MIALKETLIEREKKINQMSKKLELKSTSCWQHSAKVEHFLCATAFGVGRSVAAMSLCICQPSPKMFLELKKKCFLHQAWLWPSIHTHITPHHPPPLSSSWSTGRAECLVGGGEGLPSRSVWVTQIYRRNTGSWVMGREEEKENHAGTNTYNAYTKFSSAFSCPLLCLLQKSDG